MKRILSIILAVAALSACTKEPGYVIKGQAGELDGKAVLAYALPDGTPFSDTVAMNKGKFTFKGSVPDVVIGSVSLLPAGEAPLRANVYVENCPLTMNVNLDKVIDYARNPEKVTEGSFQKQAELHHRSQNQNPSSHLPVSFRRISILAGILPRSVLGRTPDELFVIWIIQ